MNSLDDVIRKISPLTDKISFENYIKAVQSYYADASKVVQSKQALCYVNFVHPNIYVVVLDAIRLAQTYEKKRQTVDNIDVHSLFGTIQNNENNVISVDGNIKTLCDMINAIPVGTKEFTWKVKNEYARTINGMSKTFMANLDSCTNKQTKVQKENLKMKNTIEILTKSITTTLHTSIVEKYNTLDDLTNALIRYVNAVIEIIPFDKYDNITNIYASIREDSDFDKFIKKYNYNVLQYALYYFYGLVKYFYKHHKRLKSLSSSSSSSSNDFTQVTKDIFNFTKYIFDFIFTVIDLYGNNDDDGGGRSVVDAAANINIDTNDDTRNKKVINFGSVLNDTLIRIKKTLEHNAIVSKDTDMYKQRIFVLENDMRRIDKELLERIRENEILREKITGYDIRQEKMQDRFADMEHRYATLINEYEKLQKTYNDANNDGVADYQKHPQYMALLDELLAQKLRTEQMENDKRTVERINEQLNEKYTSLRNKMMAIESESNALRNRHEERHAGETVEKLQQQLRSIEMSELETKRQNEHILQLYATLQNDYKNLQQSHSANDVHMRERINELENINYSLNSINEELTLQMGMLQDNYNLLDHKYNENLKRIVGETDAIKMEHTHCIEHAKKLDVEIKRLNEEKEELEKQRAAHRDYETEMERLREENEKLQNRWHDMSNDVSKAFDEKLYDNYKTQNTEAMELFLRTSNKLMDIVEPLIVKTKNKGDHNKLWKYIDAIRKRMKYRFVVNVTNEYEECRCKFPVDTRQDVLNFIMSYQFINSNLTKVINNKRPLLDHKIPIRKIFQDHIRHLLDPYQNQTSSSSSSHAPSSSQNSLSFDEYFLDKYLETSNVVTKHNKTIICRYLLEKFFIGPIYNKEVLIKMLATDSINLSVVLKK